MKSFFQRNSISCGDNAVQSNGCAAQTLFCTCDPNCANNSPKNGLDAKISNLCH